MTVAAYHDLLANKRVSFEPRGLASVPALSDKLFPHQRHSTEFALRAGCSAMFLDTGLGKSFCALEWGRVIVEHTNKSVLMLAPLAVGPQHQREAEKFGIDAHYVRDPAEIKGTGIWITNYERLDKFDASQFAGVILDESSILKSFTGATTRALMAAFADTPYRLACTATPAPNDHMELGQHCQFLGVMDSNEMLARWFLADQTNMGKYRLKKAAVAPFWEWVASWARCIAKPSDIGLDDAGFALPDLVMHQHIVASDRSIDCGEEKGGQGRLLRMPETSATSIHREKRLTVEARAEKIAAMVAAETEEPWIVWCDTDYEADALTDRIPHAMEVRGSMRQEVKEERLIAFSTGKARVIVTKPSIAGFGLNWQHCARQAFVGLSFSYESFYQAVRRSHRFGQTRPVHVHVAMADTEKAIWDVIKRKSGDHESMKGNMRAAMKRVMMSHRTFEDYVPTGNVVLPEWIKSWRGATA
tara:strand:+ start:1042 stop:2460 length:1419 start_codon:yes stop_codon:yes gene_type:complete